MVGAERHDLDVFECFGYVFSNLTSRLFSALSVYLTLESYRLQL